MARKTNNVKMIQNMLDDHRYSDFVFSVNESLYRASRCIVAGASDVFEALVNGAFQEAQDKKVVIKDISHDKSFYNILAYVYGHDLDFRVIPEEILCEMLRLAKMYNLQTLFEDLKNDLDKLKHFHTGSAVELLNTAHNYDLKNLYERMKKYIFQNTKYLLTHKTFVNIQYEILLDLLKSTLFYDKEINIFRALLKWIHENEIYKLSDVGKKDKLIMDLLKQIRFPFISLVDYYLLKDEAGADVKIFSKYKKIVNDKLSEDACKPRTLSPDYGGILVNFTAVKFGEDWDKCYFSPIYEVKDLQWKLIVNLDPKNTNVSILLDCKPVNKCEYWECVVDFNFKVSSKKSSEGTGPYSYTKTFSLSEFQLGEKSFTSRSTFLDACVQDESFEIELCVKPHDPVFT